MLATQALYQKKPRQMRVRFDGALGRGVTPKDLILHLIGEIGAAAGSGHAVEFAGAPIRALTVEGRLTICNLSVELGAKIGMIAPDEKTFAYLKGRPLAPKGAEWDQARRQLARAAERRDAAFDGRRDRLRGTSPRRSPGAPAPSSHPRRPPRSRPGDGRDPGQEQAMQAALDYMGLAGQPIAGQDRLGVHRLVHQRPAVRPARRRRGRQGRKVAGMSAPGSCRARRTSSAHAEAEGLDRVFLDAGFEWREPGCSMCLAVNGDTIAPRAEERVDLQPQFRRPPGPGARTHLASPAMAAAAAIAGRIADVRSILSGAKTWSLHRLDAKAAPLMRQNVNTDIIIRIHRLRDVAQAELGPYAFEPLRYLPDGSENPGILPQPAGLPRRQIVVADNNFACELSREGAVWAMMGMGVRCVIAPSFGADLLQQLLPERRAADPALRAPTFWPSPPSSRPPRGPAPTASRAWPSTCRAVR